MGFFEKLDAAPPDPILGLTLAYKRDPREMKVNLGAGIYQTADLRPYILETVKKAEKILLEQETSKDYLPIDGDPNYVNLTKELVFDSPVDSERIYGAQTVGGTAALRVGGAFLRLLGHRRLYLSNPTWANHRRIFTDACLEVLTYPYYDGFRNQFDFDRFYEGLSEMPSQSVILLQGCCHNPTGFDPTEEQWVMICERIKEKQLFPLIDFAYQGFGFDPQSDASSVRLFLNAGIPCVVAVSHSKNFGLYAERTGALYFLCSSSEQAKRIGSHVKLVIRGLYSNPPCHGSRIVATILQNKELKNEWLNELSSMRGRIFEMRQVLISLLEKKSNCFTFLKNQQGMFSYTGLNSDQVSRLIADYGIYLPKDGRINVAGLNQINITYVADAILAVTS